MAQSAARSRFSASKLRVQNELWQSSQGDNKDLLAQYRSRRNCITMSRSTPSTSAARSTQSLWYWFLILMTSMLVGCNSTSDTGGTNGSGTGNNGQVSISSITPNNGPV